MNKRSRRLGRAALACFVLAALGYLACPDILAPSVLPAFLGLILGLSTGPKAWREALKSLFSIGGRLKLKITFAALLSIAILLALGGFHFLPVFDFSPNRFLGLAPETQELLTKIDRPVHIKIYLGPQHVRETRVRELLKYYSAAAPQVTFEFLNPQTQTSGGDDLRVTEADTAEIKAEHFFENISPVNETTLNSALARLVHPGGRLVYFLNTYGEKSIADSGPTGLSHWGAALAGQRIIARDYYWAEDQLPPLGADALVLAGPKAPLGEIRETMLHSYLKSGGRLLIMADPFTVTFSADFWKPLGYRYPAGLVLDPEAAMAGTEETFVVTKNFPQHPLTKNIRWPVVFPLTGALMTTDEGKAEWLSYTFVAAASSPSSWLETDPVSFNKKDARYQAEKDFPGPLALGAISEIKVEGQEDQPGRLVTITDSDWAANAFWGHPGNRNLSLAAIHWLLDGDSAPQTMMVKTPPLVLDHLTARLIFWLPAVAWPICAMGLWLFFCWRRRR